MSARRLLCAALSIPCAFVAAQGASAQDRSVYGPIDPAKSQTAPVDAAARSPARLPVVEEPAPEAPITTLESWSLGDGAELALGRFRVTEIARPRTNLETDRDLVSLAPETDRIAGAGIRIRFR